MLWNERSERLGWEVGRQPPLRTSPSRGEGRSLERIQAWRFANYAETEAAEGGFSES